MTITRYDLDRKYAANVSVPAIVEMPEGAYVRFEDHQRLLSACETHNEMLLLRAQKAEAELEAIGAGGVSLMGADGIDAERWRKTLARVGMMMDAHGVKFYVRAKAVQALDCSVAEHFTAAIDAVPQEQEK